MLTKVIKQESELRCEISETEVITVKLTSGSAEIFGIEMALNKEYVFQDENIAIFTWYGCTVDVSGNYSPDKVYESDKTPMVAYVNTHAQLQAKRDVALANLDLGPCVLVVGPPDHGKSTASRIIAAYAARLDRLPIYVDFDIGLGSVNVPGSMCAVPLEKSSMNIEDGFSAFMPLVYFHGHDSPQGNIELFKRLSAQLASKVFERLNKDNEAKASGIIINTTGWVDGKGNELLSHYIDVFKVDVVLVMNSDKLYSSLHSSLSSSSKKITVVNLASSGGIVRRDGDARRKLRKSKIKEYFYGTSKLRSVVFSPSRQDLRISALKLYKAGGVQLSEGMRLVGDDSSADMTALVKVVATADMVHTVVAVLHHTAADSETAEPISLLTGNVAGYLWIVQVDMDQDLLTVLSPCPGQLPSKNLLLSSIKWIE